MDPPRLDPTPPVTPPDNRSVKGHQAVWNAYRGSPFPSPPSPTSQHSSGGRRGRHSLSPSTTFYTPNQSPQQASESSQQHFQHSPTPPPFSGPNDPYAHLPRLVDAETGSIFPPRPRIYPPSGVSASAPTPPSRSMSMTSVDLSDMTYDYSGDTGTEDGVIWESESFDTDPDAERLSQMFEQGFASLGASPSARDLTAGNQGEFSFESHVHVQVDLSGQSGTYYGAGSSYASYHSSEEVTTDPSPPSSPISVHVPYGHAASSDTLVAEAEYDAPPPMWVSLPDLEPALPPPSTISQFTPDWKHDDLVKTFPTLGPVCLTSTRWLTMWEQLRARRWIGGRYFPQPEEDVMRKVVDAGRLVLPSHVEEGPLKNRYYSFHDFDWLRTLGTGTFGRVHLGQSRHNGRLFAIKVLLKAKVVSLHQVEHTNQERALLLAASAPSTAYALHSPDQPPDPRDLDDPQGRSPFLVALHGTWQDNMNVYLVMDYVSGGELFGLLRRAERFPLGVARFYAAEVALALAFLHSMDIIYRDLKPENILITPTGHIKLTDFGFAKYVPDLTFTLCGTPDYLAPELIAHRPYTKSVDWYSLGVLVFEMLVGCPPFQAPNPALLYQCILQGEPHFPEQILGETEIAFMQRTMTKELTNRYGHASPGDAAPVGSGAEELMRDPFWAGIEWEALEASAAGVFGVGGGVRVPWIPEDGTFNFDHYGELDVSAYDPSLSMEPLDPYAGQFPEF